MYPTNKLYDDDDDLNGDDNSEKSCALQLAVISDSNEDSEPEVNTYI